MMRKRLLTLLLLPLILGACAKEQPAPVEEEEPIIVDPVDEVFDTHSITHPRKSGEIGEFNLISPDNDFSTNHGFLFTWEEADNCDYYVLELASTVTFVSDDEDEVYVKESNISVNRFMLSYTLPKKDIPYYWKVTAVNKDHTQVCNESRHFVYESIAMGEIPIKIEDAQDWVLHKEGSYADISIDRSDFFGTGENSLAIVFDKEHTNQGIPKSDGWIVVTKSEDRELYGTDAFYFNFYYSGHDATVLVRVLDYDGEYWHQQVKISNNSKQTILMRYDEFELRTAGTNIFNKKFDWEHIRYFEIVFERTFGDGICLFSNIKAVKFDDYKDMFIQKMNFNLTNKDEWTYENFDFEKEISEDGNEITLTYQARSGTNPNGFNGYGYQNVNVYKYLVQGDALRLKMKYTGTSSNAMFYFRVLEEDGDRWQFKMPFSYFTKDEYKELVLPLKAFQRTEYMSGDGAKQFYFIQKFNIGLADNYSSGSISIKDLEVIKIDDIVDSRKRVVPENGCIENFNNYNIYTEMYYYWEQSVVNKDEAMKLDNTHKTGGGKNPYCAEFDYKADMEQAVYQLYLDTSAVENKTAFSIWLKDSSVKYGDSAIDYIDPDDVAAEMTIQLTMDSGEWYRYTIDKVLKEWNKYTIAFTDFELFNGNELFDEPLPLASNHIIHLAFGFKYLYYDEQGNHHPTYAIANPVYLDEIYFTDDTESSINELSGTIKEDKDNPNRITIETMEGYETQEDMIENWSFGNNNTNNHLEISNEVSSQGGAQSLKMNYAGADSVSYVRSTQFGSGVTAKGLCLDIKGDGKAIVYVNINWRLNSTTLIKLRYAIYYVPETWTHYEIGFELFADANSETRRIMTQNHIREIESISFGVVNNDNTSSEIYMDNLRLLKNIGYTTFTSTTIDQEGE